MLYPLIIETFEPPHDKTNKITVRPAKTQISPRIRAVWSEFSLCAQWVNKGPSLVYADSEASDQTAGMPRLWVFAGRICHFVGFVMRRLISHIIQTSKSHAWISLSWAWDSWGYKTFIYFRSIATELIGLMKMHLYVFTNMSFSSR